MERLPPEILLQIFTYFSPYTILTTLQAVCKSFAYTTAILIPDLKIAGLPPALWEKVLSHVEYYKYLHNISRTSSSFHELLHRTRLSRLQSLHFQLPTSKAEEVFPLSTENVTEHPAFESICCRIELGSLIYHKTGNACPTDLLSFPVSEENATSPPVDRVLVKFSARYGVTLRPVLITKNKEHKDDSARGVTVGDVYRAMRRLFIEPLTEKQSNALRETREWEARKHEAVKKAVSKIEREAAAAAARDASGTSTASASSLSTNNVPEPDETEELKEPVIEHDESEICFEEPIKVEYVPHPPNGGSKEDGGIQRQREFLYDFPYVYASAHTNISAPVSDPQVFVLTYH